MALLAPPVDVTNTLAVPARPTEVAAVIAVEPTRVTAVATVPPMATAVAPVKSEPAKVTDCPPASGPDEGLRAVAVEPA